MTVGMDMNSIIIKVVDMYEFRLEVTLEEAVTLNQVEERVKEQGRVWWAYEANKGVGWYMNLDGSSSNLNGASNGSSSSFNSTVSNAGNSMLLKRLVRKGIPPQLRPKVWKAISGAGKKKDAAPEGYYGELLREVQGKETPATLQIENDLQRTFPGHPKVDSTDGLQALRRILVAYSWRDSRVGYCQGMNYIAAYLLMVLKNEEEAFWLLATLLEDVLYQEFYTEDLFGCHVEQRVLKDLLNSKLPKLSAHFDKINFDMSVITTEWFLCVFAKSFPSETTFRIWDVLFNEGAKVLFRIALALFKMKESELLQAAHAGEVISIFRNSTKHMFDPDVLLKVAFEKLGSMSMTLISKNRKKQETYVAAALENRLQRKGNQNQDS